MIVRCAIWSSCFLHLLATGRGANPVALLAPSVEPATGALAWAATRVAVRRVGGADGSLILFAGSKTEHPDHGRG
jgi:hypothetical protein